IEDPYSYYNNPDVLLHLAWRNGFDHNNKSHIFELPYHFQFIEKMADTNIKRIAVMGTMHEIGFYEGSIKEFTPANPESYYGISKNALRNATKLICKKNNKIYQWLRGYYIVGNTTYGSNVFSKMMRASEQGLSLFPFTSGCNQWDFLDYDTFCFLTAATVEQDSVDGVINICNGKPEKLSERAEKFIRDNKLPLKLDYGKYPDRPYDSKAVWGDDSKVQAILKSRHEVFQR
ncbi:MAG: NAD(P)-dependent oxidoreductase, partial [Butyrivibrio sp.]|nr:NAD(P)-dependent oxidoreductase [Butyrivibrio sp.]